MNWFLVSLICLNLVVIILESIEWIGVRLAIAFFTFEVLSVAVFSVEYLMRLWCSVERPDGRFRHPVTGRLRYALTPLALVDLIAVFPFYISMFFGTDLLFLRALRLLRVLKLTRYSSAWATLQRVTIAEARPMAAAVFVLGVLTLVAACLTYLVEHAAQPEAFASIPHSMWWAVITMTTVGYGDVVPVTFWGKVFGALIGIMGIGLVALPAGFLASAFASEVHRRPNKREASERQLGEHSVSKCPHCGRELPAKGESASGPL
ncbi:MAG: ion transporter [Methyloceanibacter sp.]|nr:ion transporter [Methyloceanibacter sp.]